jgi:hypothetical protein
MIHLLVSMSKSLAWTRHLVEHFFHSKFLNQHPTNIIFVTDMMTIKYSLIAGKNEIVKNRESSK